MVTAPTPQRGRPKKRVTVLDQGVVSIGDLEVGVGVSTPQVTYSSPIGATPTSPSVPDKVKKVTIKKEKSGSLEPEKGPQEGPKKRGRKPKALTSKPSN